MGSQLQSQNCKLSKADFQKIIFYSKDKYIVQNSPTLKYLLLAKKQLSAGNL